MCGIIGILPRPSTRSVPTATSIEELLTAAVNAGTDCSLIADALMAADQLLRGDAGIQALVGNATLILQHSMLKLLACHA
jgi:hypothetical protein